MGRRSASVGRIGIAAGRALLCVALVACAGAPGGGTNGAAASEPSPIGVVWQLQRIRYADVEFVEPDDPAKYTLELGDDRRAAVRADCNRGSAAYTLDGSGLSFGPMAMTLAACPPGSLGQRYAMALASAVSYTIRDGMLRISIAAGGGILEFAPAPREP
ncbi:MAG TPA: META domain-containing protein [Myxococcota bacterium]|jgi:para-nitrobenzyl esterase|nr:META domain-containing protein [Myxococcota bacterium]